MNSLGHRPQHPSWSCVHCGQDWPCANWRDDMGRARRDSKPTLMIYLARIMLAAEPDLPGLTSYELVARFLEWVRLPPPPAKLPGGYPWWASGSIDR